MPYSINEIPRPVRRRLQCVVRKSKDNNHYRRAHAILLLWEGHCKCHVANLLQAARSSVDDWLSRYETYGEAGLVPERPGPPERTVNDSLRARLLELVEDVPSRYGYHRSRWSSELLALQLARELNVSIHASTVRRLLPKLGIVYNRARPTLCIRDPQKDRKIRAIRRVLKRADANHPVFYVDEADIDLNPRIGPAWMKKGTQTAIPTPGKNQKRYLAGALHSVTGEVIWVEGDKKNAYLFIRLLAALRKVYRRARRIIVIADNYVIHKSAITQCFLGYNGKFKLLFQPVYYPWINKIEKLWKQLHENVTRNHRYANMNQMMDAVRYFMHNVSPFPGTNVALLKN